MKSANIINSFKICRVMSANIINSFKTCHASFPCTLKLTFLWYLSKWLFFLKYYSHLICSQLFNVIQFRGNCRKRNFQWNVIMIFLTCSNCIQSHWNYTLYTIYIVTYKFEWTGYFLVYIPQPNSPSGSPSPDSLSKCF